MQMSIQLTDFQDSPFEIGRQQWSLLADLIKQYEHVDVSAFLHNSSLFDDVWYLKDSSVPSFIFGKHFSKPEHYPFKVFIQVMSYELVIKQRYSSSTVIGHLNSFCTSFLSEFQKIGVLTAHKDQPFRLMSAIDEDFITSHAQQLIAKTSKLPMGALYFLNFFQRLQHDHLKLFVSTLALPWKTEEVPIGDWREQQMEALDILLSTSKYYAPLHFETVSLIVSHSLPIIENHFDVLAGLFDCIREQKLESTSEKRKDLVSLRGVSEYVERHKGVLNEILPIRYRKKGKYEISPLFRKVSPSWFTEILRISQSACCWIILLTTGLRNIDMRHLVVNCCRPSKHHKRIWWLVTDIRKTKNRIVIPVGEPTYKAVSLLEKLRTSESEFLITNYREYDATPYGEAKREYNEDELYNLKSSNTFTTLLMILPKRYDFSVPTINDDEATPHCVRATLAGYIAENSNTAILILKRLFGHSNALMPDEYIRRNPLVIKKRDELQDEINKEIASDLAKALVREKVSGKFGEALIKGASAIRQEIEDDAKLNNESLTEIDLLQTLEDRFYQIFSDDVENGETYTLLTPMAVVCMRSTNNTTDSPCATQKNQIMRSDSNIKKAITDALGTLPNPAQCVGVSCNDALLGEKWSRPLLDSFDYFLNYRNQLEPALDIKEEAEAFVKTYAAPLRAIYKDERDEGYFDVD